MIKRLLLFLLLINLFKAKASDKGIVFTENKNQWDAKVKYRADLDGGALFLQNDRFTFHFFDKELLNQQHISKSDKILPIKSHAYEVQFKGGDANILKASEPKSSYSNYFIGKDKRKWASHVRSYKNVEYKDLYPGIDLEVLSKDNSVKYNFIVKKGSNPSIIKMVYEGVDKLTLNRKGELRVQTSITNITEQAPYAYQVINGKQVEVQCNFNLKHNEVTFDFPKGYNRSCDLVIDPILVFASYSGSTADNFGMTATYDAEGNLYSGGTAFDIGFPVTLGAYDPTYNGIVQPGRTDVVLTKYDSSGTFLRYSTYLGGANNTEVVSSLIVNTQNELFLYGATGSNDFPIGDTYYDTTFAGGNYLFYSENGSKFENGTDIYVAKLDSTGGVLLASTYIGGTSNDGVNNSSTLIYNYGDYFRGEIMLDNSGNCYVASSTYSSDFPITANAFQPLWGGGMDGCVFKFNSSLNSLLYSSFLGSTLDDGSYAITLDDSSNAYVTGGTSSPNFPITIGAYSTVYNGGVTDGYVVKINPTGSSILASTFIGTALYDQSFFVQLDKQRNVYLYGQSLGNFPVTAGVYENPNSKQFLMKLNNNLTSNIASTVFGNGNGKINLSPSAFLVDLCGKVYISGWGGNILPGGLPTLNMPLMNAHQSTTEGWNFYLMVLEKDFASLLYATYFGGSTSKEHVDGGTSRFDKRGIIYQSVCAGCWGNSDFPTTPGAWSNTNNSIGCNNGVFKFDFQIKLATAQFTSSTIEGCSPLKVEFESLSSPGSYAYWDFGNGDTSSSATPSRTYIFPGTYFVDLIAVDSTACNIRDTARKIITVHEGITANFTFANSLCSDSVFFTDSSFTQSGAPAIAWNYNFSDGDTANVSDTVHVFDSYGIHDVQLVATNAFGCKDTIIKPIPISTPFYDFTSAVNCGNQVTISNYGSAFEFFWNFGDPFTLADTLHTNDSAVYTYPDTGTYNATVILYSVDSRCNDTVTTPINVLPGLDADFYYSFSGCSSTIQFYDSSETNNVTVSYFWDFGDGQTSALADPLHTFSLNGPHDILLVISSANGCVDSIIKTIAVGNLNIQSSYNYDCSSTNIAFNNLTGLNYHWNFGVAGVSNDSISSFNNVQFAYPDTGSYTVTVIAPSQNPACNDTASFIVDVFPAPMVDFTYTINGCDSTLTFINTSTEYMPVGYTWNFGDQQTSNLEDPVHSYTASGSYSISLIITNNNGCSDTIIKPASFGPVKVISSPTYTCGSNAVLFSNGNGGNYYWDFGVVSLTSDTLTSNSGVSFSYPDTGQYEVTVVALALNAACNDTFIVNVDLQPNPIADFSYSINTCDLTVQFTSTSNGFIGASYLWNFGHGAISNLINPSHGFANTGIDTVRFIVTANGCADTIKKIIEINHVQAGARGDTILCSENKTAIILAYGGSSYSWTPSSGMFDPHAAIQEVQPGASTIYTVTITVSQVGGPDCYVIDSASVGITDSGVNDVIASADKHLIIQGETVALHAYPDTLYYIWSPLTGLSAFQAAEVNATPLSSTTYTVNVTDRYGCSATDTTYIKVLRTSCEEQDFFIPNTFTPNGDNVNDLFRVRGDIKELYFAVYDRWGEKVFETTDPKAGWDGTYKGMKVDPAVFAYYARIGCYSNKELFKKGNVTLIR